MTHECTLKEAFITKALDEIQPDWCTGADVRRETKDKIRERVAKKYADIFDPDNSACMTVRSIEATVKRVRDKLDIVALRDRSEAIRAGVRDLVDRRCGKFGGRSSHPA